MNTVLKTSTKLKGLLQTNPTGRHVSLYLPTHPSSRSETINEDSARFKSLLKDIKNTPDLHRHDQQVFSTIEKLEKLITDRTFWSKQTAGLAIFANDKQQHIFHLPFEVTQQSFVSNKFILTPLLAMQSMVEEVYLLEVNLKQPKLYHATASQLTRCTDADLPASLEEALQLDEVQQMQQFHSGEGHGRAMFHGHGGADDHKDKDIETYLRYLAKKVDIYLSDKKLPLLLVGTKPRTTSLRKKIAYKHTTKQEITGNFDTSQEEKMLLAEVQELFTKKIDQDQKQLIAEFKSAYGKELAVAGQAAVDQAAKMDNIKTLLVPMLRKTKDSVRQKTHENYIFDLPNELPNIEDSVRACHATKAEVLPIKIKKTTLDNDVVAICRYKITLS